MVIVSPIGYYIRPALATDCESIDQGSTDMQYVHSQINHVHMLKSVTMYKKSTMCYCVSKFKNDNHSDLQYRLAKGHEPRLYSTLNSIAGLFLRFTIVKMKGPNK